MVKAHFSENRDDLFSHDRLEASVGPAFDEDPYVYLSGSAGAFQELRLWADKREVNVRAQLAQPWMPRPQFSQAGGEVVAGFNLTMLAPSGAICYTLDGTDPRAPGGAVSSSALLYSMPLVVDRTTHVIARAFDGGVWSGQPPRPKSG
jgi:hypothetical protein